jgi:CRISPR-associated protein Csd1
MILQALYEYYQRKSNSDKSSIASEGFEKKEIPFIIVIDKDGNFLDLQFTGDSQNKKGKSFSVPKSIGRPGKNGWQIAFLLWDHYGYVLAHPKSKSEKDVQTALKQNKSFVEKILSLPDNIKNEEKIQAIIKFYENKQNSLVFKHQIWQDCEKVKGCYLSFRIARDLEIIPEQSYIKMYIEATLGEEKEDNTKGKTACLITGKRASIKRLHTAIPIGAESATKLVGFQVNSGYDSYGKEQGFNAPVSEAAESAYTTALKVLIKSEKNKYIISDSTFVFWSEKESEFTDDFASFFRDTRKDDPDYNSRAVRNLYESLHTGKLNDQSGNKFFLLGLCPANRARISVRFWKAGTVLDFAKKIRKHFDDLEIVKGEKDREYFGLAQLLKATALSYEQENIPPNLSGDMIRAILEDMPYPATLLNNCIARIRAEQSKKDKAGRLIRNVTSIRAAILKAYINRQIRYYNKQERSLTMSLDYENKSPAYRLGRLFAILEKIQEDASGGNLNTTIRDRFYSSASSSPSTVFPLLIRLKNAHLKKLSEGKKINKEKEIGEIMDGIPTILPSHLNLNDQATFAVGYYHQRQSFYQTKQDKKGE